MLDIYTMVPAAVICHETSLYTGLHAYFTNTVNSSELESDSVRIPDHALVHEGSCSTDIRIQSSCVDIQCLWLDQVDPNGACVGGARQPSFNPTSTQLAHFICAHCPVLRFPERYSLYPLPTYTIFLQQSVYEVFCQFYVSIPKVTYFLIVCPFSQSIFSISSSCLPLPMSDLFALATSGWHTMSYLLDLSSLLLSSKVIQCSWWTRYAVIATRWPLTIYMDSWYEE